MHSLVKLVEELDRVVHVNNSLPNSIRIAALIVVNWDQVRKALLAWDGKERSNLECKEQECDS